MEMNQDKKLIARIDLNYAFVQSTYWITYCAIGSFATLYLAFRGLDNTTIGMTASFYALLAIMVQLVISDFCDRNPQIPIKYVISAMYMVEILACFLMLRNLSSMILLTLIFSLAVSFSLSINGYLNAQMVQFNNAGIPAHYGWPRGVGSLTYAISAAVLGVVVEKYTPGIIPKIVLTGSVVSIVVVLLMPKPTDYAPSTVPKKTADKTAHISYGKMLKTNKILQVFLITVILYGLGQTAGFTFMIRVLERIQKGSAEFGVTELIRAGMEMPMLFFAPLVMKRLGSRQVVNISYFCGAFRILTIAFAPNLFWVYIGSAMNIAGSGFYIFGTVQYVNSITGPSEKVRAQSLVALCYSAGSILGNLYAGIMLDAVGLFWMLLGGAAFNLIGGFLLMKKTEKQDNTVFTG